MRELSRVVFVDGAIVATTSTNVPVKDGVLLLPDLQQSLQFAPTSCILSHPQGQPLAFQHPMFLPSLTYTTPKTMATILISTTTLGFD